MPLSTTLSAPRHPRLASVAAVAAVTCATVGAAVVGLSDHPGSHVLPPAQSTSGREDVEANKAAAMRALGLHRAARYASPGARYFDVEANKARYGRNR